MRTKDSVNVQTSSSQGEGDVLILMSVLVSVLVAGAGDSLIIVVSFFSDGGFVTVVSFCSHPASNAAPIKRQIYLFVQKFDGRRLYLFRESAWGSPSCYRQTLLLEGACLFLWWLPGNSLDSMRGRQFQFFVRKPRARRRRQEGRCIFS